VESVEHGELLLWLGCELAQGYGIAHPMAPERLPAWAADWRPPATWSKRPPIGRQHLPALFAMVEHRTWSNAVEDFLLDRSKTLPPLETHQCRFGRWLITDAADESPESIAPLDALHERFHAHAIDLINLKKSAQASRVAAGLKELYRQRDELQDQMQSLIGRMAGTPRR
jgi:hypothetical protein